MEYKVNKNNKGVAEIEIKLDATEWQKEVEEAYSRTRGKYKIEGFRAGKAPRKVIEKMYGQGVFFEEALSEAFYHNYMNVLSKEKNIEPIDAPNLDVKDMTDDGVTMVATVAVKPEVKVAKYTGFNIEVKQPKITKADIETEIEKVREQNARLTEVETAIKLGDIANINFSGSVDGVKFDGGTSENYDLEIGSKSFIDNFEDQLIGLKAKESKDVVVKFPENYHVKELANKPAKFEVLVNAVKVKQLPELNDEFANNVSEFETMADYKKHVEEHLMEHAMEHSKIEAENAILDKIVENTTVEIPAIMVEHELENIIKDMEYRLMYQGLNLETYAGYMNTTVEKIKADRREDALKSVKIRLALTFILDKEKISIEESEVNEKIKEMAKSAKKTIKEFKETITEERINYIKNDILMNKLLIFLIDNNTAKKNK